MSPLIYEHSQDLGDPLMFSFALCVLGFILACIAAYIDKRADWVFFFFITDWRAKQCCISRSRAIIWILINTLEGHFQIKKIVLDINDDMRDGHEHVDTFHGQRQQSLPASVLLHTIVGWKSHHDWLFSGSCVEFAFGFCGRYMGAEKSMGLCGNVGVSDRAVNNANISSVLRLRGKWSFGRVGVSRDWICLLCHGPLRYDSVSV